MLKKMNTEHIDKEYLILEKIYNKQDSIRQRDLAHIAGISLGMTNAIVKQLVIKGLLVARKINHRNIHYAVTPAGINEIIKRSYRYFKTTVKTIVAYRTKIEKLIKEIKKQGYTVIILVGISDLDFLIEQYCQKNSLQFLRHSDRIKKSEAVCEGYYLLNENISNAVSYSKLPHISLFQELSRGD
jgi:DNA-binding MarR family transcriptional regulator